MSSNFEPKQGDRIGKSIEPDLKKGNSSSAAPSKPVQPQKPSVSPNKQKAN